MRLTRVATFSEMKQERRGRQGTRQKSMCLLHVHKNGAMEQNNGPDMELTERFLQRAQGEILHSLIALLFY